MLIVDIVIVVADVAETFFGITEVLLMLVIFLIYCWHY